MPYAWIRPVKTVFAFTAIYMLAVGAVNRFAFSEGWNIVWPLNGVTIALLLMRLSSRHAAAITGTWKKTMRLTWR